MPPSVALGRGFRKENTSTSVNWDAGTLQNSGDTKYGARGAAEALAEGRVLRHVPRVLRHVLQQQTMYFSKPERHTSQQQTLDSGVVIEWLRVLAVSGPDTCHTGPWNRRWHVISGRQVVGHLQEPQATAN
ncbi:hypothetical protein ElyMa_001101000 [Elysia marginata]|uniref:Uncharacterized protein n=1 Tax=Elysia marginata TaxID=1093978 RepID=A0AAV4HUE1_9GAST|nr:hypothetical protein ElyMa_001101000 [Elysia marginata]